MHGPLMCRKLVHHWCGDQVRQTVTLYGSPSLTWRNIALGVEVTYAVHVHLYVGTLLKFPKRWEESVVCRPPAWQVLMSSLTQGTYMG